MLSDHLNQPNQSVSVRVQKEMSSDIAGESGTQARGYRINHAGTSRKKEVAKQKLITCLLIVAPCC